MKIMIEDCYGNDVAEIKYAKKIDFEKLLSSKLDNFSVADKEIDEFGEEYIRIQQIDKGKISNKEVFDLINLI